MDSGLAHSHPEPPVPRPRSADEAPTRPSAIMLT